MAVTDQIPKSHKCSCHAGAIHKWFKPTGERAKTTESGGIRGFDAGKRVKGRKRVRPAGRARGSRGQHSGSRRSASGPGSIRARWPWLRHVFADGGYAGPKLEGALRRLGAWTIQIVKRSDTAKGFELLPKRWIVERTFAWLGRCRRLAKDWEKSIASAEAWIFIAHIRVLTRRLARYWQGT